MEDSQSDSQFDPTKYDFRGFAWRSIVIIILTTLTVSLFFGLIINIVAPNSSLSLLGLTTFFGMFVPTLLIVKYSPFTYQAALRLRSFDPKLFLIGLLGLVACIGVEIGSQSFFYRLIPDVFDSVHGALDSQLYNELASFSSAGLLSPQFFFSVFVIAVVPAVGEEFFFRGVFLKTLENIKTPWKAVLISSIVFSILHVNPFNIFPIFVLGFLLGAVAVSTGSIYPSMIFHFIFNLSSVIALFVDPSTASVNSNQDLPELPFAIIILLASLTAAYFIIKYLISKATSAAWVRQN